ncbi:MAG: beta-ketoacyl synthase [Acidobacteria bacterium]|nr:MAG: beta-ketoacyl synthase [Acidobacteriota bacterium]REK07692.1 MAG: beta-ketoacyl synthase [Acidobacteriota bacterium]
MNRIPVIAGFGGINAAGRSSAHHGYRRTVIGALDEASARRTWQSLAALVGSADRTGEDGEAIDDELRSQLERGTLVRGIEPFDTERAPWNRRLAVEGAAGAVELRLSRRDLPTVLPPSWTVLPGDEDSSEVVVRLAGRTEILLPDERPLGVGSAGQVPTGFDPAALYQERSHPRAVQLTLFAASDCLASLGIPWETVTAAVPPDRIATYAGSAMAQLDECGNGGLLGARWRGQRISSKNVPMGLAEMAADFVNAYVLGSVGRSGHNMGACATFLYNLRLGIEDIASGRARVVLVGGAEAPIVPDVVDGLATMGALAADKYLLAIEGREEGVPDFRRACRPFGENCGFVIAEGAQFALLMDDELALEIGADVHASVGDVFVHADGFKKSISSPGVGNYVTFAKAAASALRALGDEALRQRSFVMAHGTGTPQNRTSESEILDLVARAFGIERWPVAAVKCFVGHTMGAAGGDQLMSALGAFEHGVIPGIPTIDAVAADVVADRLLLQREHLERDPESLDVAFLNAKGFGGNNATATVYSPAFTRRLLRDKHGERALDGWSERVQATREAAAENDRRARRQGPEVTYRFNHQVREHQHVQLDTEVLRIEGYPPIEL